MAVIPPVDQLSALAEKVAALQALFAKQRAAFRNGGPEYAKRVEALKRLEAGVLERQESFVRATSEDFGHRARQETLALEFAPLLDAIRHARRNLASWMRPKHVSAGVNFFPARAKVVFQPLGVVGIIGAWNYPTFLTLSPLVDALAAGNHALIKPSELAPATAEVLRKLIADTFPEEYVAVVAGDARVAAEFAALPFDHLLFTGSTRVGKLIMRAASEHLTPVTLELGGKSPAIVHREFPLGVAAERILTGKLYNAGQTCLAPDYVFIHESQAETFVRVAQDAVQQLYPAWSANPDYTRIINAAHYARLHENVEDALAHGARVVPLGSSTDGCDSENRIFAPVLLLDVNETMRVMQEEIFGPILPVLTYREISEAIAYVNAHPRPLALYYFDDDAKRVERMLTATVSGGVTVNDVLYHVGLNNLPFGGVGPSGMGAYHGRTGFETFSMKKGVMLQSRFSAVKFLRPPYGAMAERVIRFLLRR